MYVGNRWFSGRYPIGRRASVSRVSLPNASARPEVGCAHESSIFTNVVFPAPFGPNSPNVDPGLTRSDTPSTAVSSRPDQRLRKTLVNPSVSIANGSDMC